MGSGFILCEREGGGIEIKGLDHAVNRIPVDIVDNAVSQVPQGGMVIIRPGGKGDRIGSHGGSLFNPFLERSGCSAGKSRGIGPACRPGTFHHLFRVSGNGNTLAVYMPAFIPHRNHDIKRFRRVLVHIGHRLYSLRPGHAAHMDVVDIDSLVDPVIENLLPAAVKGFQLLVVQADQVAVDKGKIGQEAVPDTRQLGNHRNAQNSQHQQADDNHRGPGAAVFLFTFVFRPVVPDRRRGFEAVKIVKKGGRRAQAVIFFVGGKVTSFTLLLLRLAVIVVPGFQSFIPAQGLSARQGSRDEIVIPFKQVIPFQFCHPDTPFLHLRR